MKKILNILLPIVLIIQFLMYLFDKESRVWFVPLTLICYSLAILILWFIDDIAMFISNIIMDIIMEKPIKNEISNPNLTRKVNIKFHKRHKK